MKDLPWKTAVKLSSSVLKVEVQSRTHKPTFLPLIFLVLNIQSTVHVIFIVTSFYFCEELVT